MRDVVAVATGMIFLTAAFASTARAQDVRDDTASIATSLSEMKSELQEIAGILKQLVAFRERELLLQEIDLEQKRLEPQRRALEKVQNEMRELESELAARKEMVRAAVASGELEGEEELRLRDDMKRWDTEVTARLETLDERRAELEEALRFESADLEDLRRRLVELRRAR